MIKSKRKLAAIATAVFLAVGCFGFTVKGKFTKAEAVEKVKSEEIVSKETQSEDDSITRLFTNISLTLDGGNGMVFVTAKNEFTLFSSTVYVIVELYSSSSYQTSYENMTLMSTHSTPDLNMGESISAQATTGGVPKYWLGRMLYQIDGSAWQERNTLIRFFNANGEIYQGSIFFSLS